jgi:Na+/proline symporter
MGVLTVGLVILSGIVIFATYADCDPVSEGKIKTTDQIVPHFVIEHLAFIPGLMGLFVAVILSAVLSTISSSLNSLAAVTWEDFLCQIPWFAKMEDKAQAFMYKLISALYGLSFVGLAFVAQSAGSIFQATLTVVGATSGVLGSIFVMGVFLPFINKIGAMSGMISGLIVMAGITVKGLLLLGTYNHNEKLSISVSNCSMEVQVKNSTYTDLEYPDKLFTISYLLYPLIGAFVTIVVGIIVSIFVNCASSGKRPVVPNKYLHPILHTKAGREKPIKPGRKSIGGDSGTDPNDINMNTYM